MPPLKRMARMVLELGKFLTSFAVYPRMTTPSSLGYIQMLFIASQSQVMGFRS
jgi:hypothetical protein